MNPATPNHFRRWLAIAALAFASCAHAQVTFYEHDDFGGRSFTAERAIDDFDRIGFNDRASSVVVRGGTWEVCDDAGFRGHCVRLRAGRYPSLGAMDMNDRVSSARAVDDRRREGDRGDRGDRGGPPRRGEITFFTDADFRGASVTVDDDVDDFNRMRFNDRASSVIVSGEGWEACEDVGYSGRCVALRPGRYSNLAAIGLNDRLSSVRRIRGGGRDGR